MPRWIERASVSPLLHRDRRHAVSCCPLTLTMSPSANTSGWPATRQVGPDGDPAGAVGLRTGGLREQAREWGGGDTRGPHRRTCGDARAGAVGRLHLDRFGVDVDDGRAEHRCDAK